MNDRVKAEQVLYDVRAALTTVAAKYNLEFQPSAGRFGQGRVSIRVEFVEKAVAASESNANADFCAYSFSKGATLTIRKRLYRVDEIKPSGVVVVARIPDGKVFKVRVSLAKWLSERFADSGTEMAEAQ